MLKSYMKVAIRNLLDEEVQKQYTAEERWTKIVGYASILAVVIACLGLFGLTALAATQRKKEIGLRKVLGATSQVLFHCCREISLGLFWLQISSPGRLPGL